MTQLVVLSHTRMTDTRFCMNVAGRNQATNQIIQIRPHVAPNEALEYRFFGPRAQTFRDQLRPGSVLDIKHFYPVTNPRVTHPEDRVVKPEEVALVSALDWSKVVLEYAKEMAVDDIHQLFSGLFQQPNGKLYRPDGLPNAQSVGYVRAQSVTYFHTFDKLRGQVTDAAGNYFSAPVVGVDLLASHEPVQESLVRLSLSGPVEYSDWKTSSHPERCFLMLSHVIEL